MAHRLVINLSRRRLRSRHTARTDKDSKQVVLHEFFPSRGVPNASPPCLKLETFLRMADIPYEAQYGLVPSSKGKRPWIEYKGSEIADSHFCIEFLCKEFDVDLDGDLTPSQRATARAFQRTCDENTYWALVYHRWVDEFESTKKMFKLSNIEFMNNLAANMMRRHVRDQLEGHGIGLHERDEVYHIASQDIQAFSDYLGDKEFMMGDKATVVDASVFGMMASFVWVDKASPMHQLVTGKCNNIESFCHRMKERFWPDWDDVASMKKED